MADDKLKLQDEDLEKIAGGDKYDMYFPEGATEEFVDKGIEEAGKLYYKKFLEGKISEEKYRKLLENLISMRSKFIDDVNGRKKELLDEINERIRKELGGSIFF